MTAALTPEDTRLVGQVRRALARPFVDPVKVGGLAMSRASARMIERNLTCSGESTGAGVQG